MDASTPLGRRAVAEEIADTALFFCSRLSRHVTGQCLVVDGGASSRFPVPLPGITQTLPS